MQVHIGRAALRLFIAVVLSALCVLGSPGWATQVSEDDFNTILRLIEENKLGPVTDEKLESVLSSLEEWRFSYPESQADVEAANSLELALTDSWRMTLRKVRESATGPRQQGRRQVLAGCNSTTYLLAIGTAEPSARSRLAEAYVEILRHVHGSKAARHILEQMMLGRLYLAPKGDICSQLQKLGFKFCQGLWLLPHGDGAYTSLGFSGIEIHSLSEWKREMAKCFDSESEDHWTGLEFTSDRDNAADYIRRLREFGIDLSAPESWELRRLTLTRKPDGTLSFTLIPVSEGGTSDES